MFVINILKTFVSKSFLLIINFGLIVFTTNMWGTEGRGYISLLIADLAIVGIVSDLISGSSLSYHYSRYSLFKLRTIAYCWSILVSILVPIVLSFFHTQDYTLYLIATSVFFSLLTCNVNIFIGSERITYYNVFTAIQPLLIAVVVGFGYFLWKSPEIYFVGQILAYASLFAISTVFVFKLHGGEELASISKLFVKLMHYGWQTQLSYLMQFMNYRLSYFFLAELYGVSSVGIFSIGVALAEAIWTVSKSISLVLYSQTVNETNDRIRVLNTKMSIKLSFYATLVVSIFILIIPQDFYGLIFGKDFSQVKLIMLLLLPGIVSIAISNVVGHYFSATYRLKVLNVKSFFGLVVTVIASFALIPPLGIVGACIAASLSYVTSSAVLFIVFYRENTFRLHELAIKRSEVIKLIAFFKGKLNVYP